MDDFLIAPLSGIEAKWGFFETGALFNAHHSHHGGGRHSEDAATDAHVVYLEQSP
jgi:hypothetical protein